MKLQCVCAHVRRGKTLCAECNMPIVFDREARIITHEVNTPDCLEAVVFPTSLGATLVPGPNHTDVTTETWRLPMFKDYDPQRLAAEKAGIGGSVGYEDSSSAGVGGSVGGEGK